MDFISSMYFFGNSSKLFITSPRSWFDCSVVFYSIDVKNVWLVAQHWRGIWDFPCFENCEWTFYKYLCTHFCVSTSFHVFGINAWEWICWIIRYFDYFVVAVAVVFIINCQTIFPDFVLHFTFLPVEGSNFLHPFWHLLLLLFYSLLQWCGNISLFPSLVVSP